MGDYLPHKPSSINPKDSPSFVPHIVRIAALMDLKYSGTHIETLPTKQNELLVTASSISHLSDLHSFFKTLSLCSNRHRTDCSGSLVADHGLQADRQTDSRMSGILEKIDRVIEMDFLDRIPR